jgi:CRISPR-associated protein Csb2
MSVHFDLSMRFLAPAFHGRRDEGKPEWPPSPMRAFQSLVAAAGATHRLAPRIRSALRWLEKQQPPTLIAPASITAAGYRLSVPNNAMDIVAKAWCHGNYSNSGDANPATHRAMKNVRPTLLLGGDALHYLWPLPEPLPEEVHAYVEILGELARDVVVLGWGVDLVVSSGALLADEQLDALPGERWWPRNVRKEGGLRVPKEGSLDALISRHEAFLGRMSADGFTPPPPLSQYDTVQYRRATDPLPSPVAVFSLRKLDASGFRAFDTPRRALTVAGMMRHATRLAAERAGWSKAKISEFILGHGESKDDAHHIAIGPRRFAYLPLPSIEGRGTGNPRMVGSVRRVMLFTFADDCEQEITWSRRSLSGQELVDEGTKQAVAFLSSVPERERVVQCYMRLAASWATVTPVVLPGYDDPSHYRRRLKRTNSAEEQKQLLDRLNTRIDGLLRKSIVQAGFSQALADNAQLEWRKSGFWPGLDLPSRYGIPDHLRRFPRYHVRVKWRDMHQRPVQLPGPVCLGGGRFHGLGLFAAQD